MDEPGLDLAASFLGLSKRSDDGRASMFALRLYGDAVDFGVSLEVSFIERKKMSRAFKSNTRFSPFPFLSQSIILLKKMERVTEGTEKNRHDLLQGVAEGTVRKVLVKYDVSLVEESSLENILDQLQEALVALEPYYLATRQV